MRKAECDTEGCGKEFPAKVSYAAGNPRELCEEHYEKECPGCRDDDRNVATSYSGFDALTVKEDACPACGRRILHLHAGQ